MSNFPNGVSDHLSLLCIETIQLAKIGARIKFKYTEIDYAYGQKVAVSIVLNESENVKKINSSS